MFALSVLDVALQGLHPQLDALGRGGSQRRQHGLRKGLHRLHHGLRPLQQALHVGGGGDLLMRRRGGRYVHGSLRGGRHLRAPRLREHLPFVLLDLLGFYLGLLFHKLAHPFPTVFMFCYYYIKNARDW